MTTTVMAAVLPVAAICAAQAIAAAVTTVSEGRHLYSHHPRHARHRGNR